MQSLLAHAGASADKVIYGPEISISWAAIAVATIAAMAIGSIWYGPLFGEKWMRLVKLSKKDTEKSWQKPMLVMLVLSVLQAFILAHFIAYAQYYYFETSEVIIGILTAFWLWAGFVLPVLGGSYLFARRSLELMKIDLGNYLVTLVAMGAIIAAIS
jgi:hypothetical protein